MPRLNYSSDRELREQPTQKMKGLIDDLVAAQQADNPVRVDVGQVRPDGWPTTADLCAFCLPELTQAEQAAALSGRDVLHGFAGGAHFRTEQALKLVDG